MSVCRLLFETGTESEKKEKGDAETKGRKRTKGTEGSLKSSLSCVTMPN
jgi:hypothetical protein